MIHKTNKKLKILYVSILPLALLTFLLALSSIKAEAAKLSLFNIKFPSILGNESEREDEDEDEDDKDDEEDKEDENEIEDKEDEEDKTEIEDEFDPEETMEILETINNPDGTVTKKVKITDEDGDIEIKLITYDKDGNIVKKEELDEDGTEHTEKVEILETTNNPDGTVTKKIKITEDDGDVEFKLITYDKDGKVIKEIELNSDGTVKDEDEDEDMNEEIETEGSAPSPEMILNLKNKLLESGIFDSIKKLSLETDDGQVEIKVKLVKNEKLFGVFKIEVPYQVLYNTSTDTIVQKVQSIWARILDLITF